MPDDRHDDPLLDELAAALRETHAEPDPGRIADLRAAAVARRDQQPGVARAPRRRRWFTARPAVALAAVVAALAIGTGLGIALTGDDGPTSDGVVEYAGTIDGPGGEGSLDVTMTGIGRVVELDTDDLEILPKGEYYEIWFAADDDTEKDPDRISAGTFHPDPDGRSHVRFAAAVDPSKFPNVIVTAEPGDGNPDPTGPVVLKTRIGTR